MTPLEFIPAIARQKPTNQDACPFCNLAGLEMAFSLPAPETGHSILDGALQVPGGVGQPLHFHITPADGKGGRT